MRNNHVYDFMNEQPAMAEADRKSWLDIDEKDKVLWRSDIQALLGVSSETMRRYKLMGRLPEPDVFFSLKKYGWRISTLRACGINIPAIY